METARQIRVQLDSRPAPIDAIERRLLQLRIESEALKGDELPATARRLTQLNEEVANLEEELASLMLQYQSEKKQSDELAALRVELEHKKWEVEKMEARYNLQVGGWLFWPLFRLSTRLVWVWDEQGAATLKYEVIPELEKRISSLVASQMTSDEAGPSLLPSLLGADQIAAVVSRWTHIPVQKLTLSDRERVLKLGERLQSRVIGQDNAVKIVADAILRSRAGVARAGQPQGAFLFLGPTGVGKTELAKVTRKFGL